MATRRATVLWGAAAALAAAASLGVLGERETHRTAGEDASLLTSTPRGVDAPLAERRTLRATAGLAGRPVDRAAGIERLLAAEPVSWPRVARAVASCRQPLSDAARARLLGALREGRRNDALAVFRNLHDGSVVPDLLELVDDRGANQAAGRAALKALAAMPGADPEEVVSELAGRLRGQVAADRGLLRAIAARGGHEVARAVVAYIERADAPRRIERSVLQAVRLDANPAAAPLLRVALERADRPAVRETLLRLAATPAARGFTAQLVALDSDALEVGERRTLLAALASIRTPAAIAHLRGLAATPGAVGRWSTRALRRIDARRGAVVRASGD